MMLPVISKKVTRKHRPQMIACLRTGVVRRHIGRLRQAVWQIRAEVKKLQRAPNTRRDPKEPNARFRNAKHIFKEVVETRHHDDLRPSFVSPNERGEPNQEVL